ncbi:MAG: hypothetical protein J6M18_01540 [Actinomycetaceae bacterium]|nr:hypothetical protein [Actinomycetaceae bacterium]
MDSDEELKPRHGLAFMIVLVVVALFVSAGFVVYWMTNHGGSDSRDFANAQDVYTQTEKKYWSVVESVQNVYQECSEKYSYTSVCDSLENVLSDAKNSHEKAYNSKKTAQKTNAGATDHETKTKAARIYVQGTSELEKSIELLENSTNIYKENLLQDLRSSLKEEIKNAGASLKELQETLKENDGQESADSIYSAVTVLMEEHEKRIETESNFSSEEASVYSEHIENVQRERHAIEVEINIIESYAK